MVDLKANTGGDILLFEVICKCVRVVTDGTTGDTSQWMPETIDSTEPYIYCVFLYTYIPMLKFNL